MNSTAKTALWIGGGLMAAALVLPAILRAGQPAYYGGGGGPYGYDGGSTSKQQEAAGWANFAFGILGNILGLAKGIFDWASDGGGGSWGGGGGSWGGGGGGADIDEDPSDVGGGWKND